MLSITKVKQVYKCKLLMDTLCVRIQNLCNLKFLKGKNVIDNSLFKGFLF